MTGDGSARRPRPRVLLGSALLAIASTAAPAAAADLAAAGRVDAAVERVGAMDGVRTVDLWVGEERVASRAFRGARHGPWDVKSASKSLLSALVGIALERGLLPGVEAKLGELLPEQAATLDDPRKRAIELRHLLTMTSGLASTSGPDYGRWVVARDWVRAALARPLEHPPGGRFVYSTGNSHLIAAALARATGEDLLAWGRRVLFDPLGLRVVAWSRDPQGLRFGGNSFVLAPEDLGRFGRLCLAGGRWEGRQLVPEKWIAESSRPRAEGWPDRYGAYGYLWWIPTFDSGPVLLASGFGGQFLLVAPESAAVLVVTSTHVAKGEPWDREILRRIDRELLPALRLLRRPEPAADPLPGSGAERRSGPD